MATAAPFGPKGTDENFAFQVGGGFQFGLTETVSLDVGYRFRGILDVDIQGDEPAECSRRPGYLQP